MFLDAGKGLRRSQRIALTVSLVLLTGCAGVSTMSAPEAEAPGGAESSQLDNRQAADQGMAAPATEAVAAKVEADAVSEPVPGSDMGQVAPQLVKQARLVLVLTDVDAAVETVQTLVRQAQGDLLNLQDYRSPDGTAHQVTLTLRVPQAQLDTVLANLRELGTVQEQSLTATDVSSQLVDLEARVKNLRQSEAALQKIMERSGEISHVLEVARELSNVRDSIERTAAQQQNLQRQVAYSQIDLTLQSPVTTVPPLRPVRETLGGTWQAATQSVRAFTVGGLKIGLWLLAYSPYLVILGALTYGGYRLRRGHPTPPPATEGEQA
jgi:hypothetical protein